MPTTTLPTHLRDLTHDPRNPRQHTARNIGMIGESLQRFGPARSITIDEDNVILAGNGVVEAAASVGIEHVRVYDRETGVLGPEPAGDYIFAVRITGLTEDEKRQYAVADNRTTDLSTWDADVLAALDQEGVDLSPFFFPDELETAMAAWGDPDEEGSEEGPARGGEGPEPIAPEEARQTLADRFLVPPFSVLDARQGYWQARKRTWLALGIQSELGRGGNLMELSDAAEDYRQRRGEYANGSQGNGPARAFGQDLMKGEHVVGEPESRVVKAGLLYGSDSGRDPDYYAQKRRVEGQIGRTLTTEEFQRNYYVNEAENGLAATGTSVFDPVLCELAYRWFCPPGGRILDPFAGGSVRGIAAHVLGRRYTGVDLSEPQVQANYQQGRDILGKDLPTWHVGDARDVRSIVGTDEPVDFVFSCPPYADLEVYSDDVRDLSTMEYDEFLIAYRQIIAAAASLLAEDRFAAFVVGDVRDPRGRYRNFVSDTIAAFLDAGLALYNEAILVTSVGSLPIRVGRQFEAGRKLGKTHQNVLVFVKGDPKKATQACGPVQMDDLLALAGGPATPGDDDAEVPDLAPDAVGDDDDFAALAAQRFAQEAEA